MRLSKVKSSKHLQHSQEGAEPLRLQHLQLSKEYTEMPVALRRWIFQCEALQRDWRLTVGPRMMVHPLSLYWKVG